MTKYVVDTHALLWFLEGNSRLGTAAGAVMRDPDAVLVVPATALAEACWLVAKGRMQLDDWRSVIKSVESDYRFEIVPLTAAVIGRQMTLHVPFEMHDGQIVATDLVLADAGDDVILLTHDWEITASRLLPVVW